MRKRVLLDVDGILADFCGAAAEVMTRVSGRLILPHTIEHWDVAKTLDSEEHRAASKSAMEEKGFCSSILPYVGAKDAVSELSKSADVLYVTAPMHKNPHWVGERLAWLDGHLGVDPNDVVFTYKKYLVGGAVIVEDSGPNADAWAKHHPAGKALLWDRPYNRQEGHGLTRVYAWDDVIAQVHAALS